MRNAMLRVGLLGPVLASFYLSGCTLIMAADHASRPDHASFPASDLRGLGPGAPMVLVLRDGESIEGRHAGLVSIPEEEYAEIYTAVRGEQPGGVLLPALGDSVVLVGVHNHRLGCEFLGFVDPMHAWVRAQGAPAPRAVPLARVREILHRDGTRSPGDAVAELLADGELPIRTAILIDDGEARRQVPMEEISEVVIPTRKGGMLQAVLIGAAVDALLVVVLGAIVSGTT